MRRRWAPMLGKKKHIVERSLEKSLLVISLVNLVLLQKFALEAGPLINVMTKMRFPHIWKMKIWRRWAVHLMCSCPSKKRRTCPTNFLKQRPQQAGYLHMQAWLSRPCTRNTFQWSGRLGLHTALFFIGITNLMDMPTQLRNTSTCTLSLHPQALLGQPFSKQRSLTSTAVPRPCSPWGRRDKESKACRNQRRW